MITSPTRSAPIPQPREHDPLYMPKYLPLLLMFISVANEFVKAIIAPNDTPIPILRKNIRYLSFEKKSSVEKNIPITRPTLIIGSFLLSFAAFLANSGADNIEKKGKIALINPIKDFDAPRTSAKFEINKLPAI